MTRVAALLAAALALALGACGDGGAEPGASREATLVLDFQPNAVHAGIYAALAAGEYERRGIELEVREPSASTDAPKLLAAGEADLAILDINDLGIARERGVDVVGVGALVHRPLAAVIAADRSEVGRPRDLEGATVGVTGLPSDDAVLDTVLAAGGLEPSAVERVTIGFDSVTALSAGRLDAATAFWNAEGVTLRDLGLSTRELRVDDFGAPVFPELVLTTSEETLATEPELIADVLAATGAGQRRAAANPSAALDAMREEVPELARQALEPQLEALLEADALGPDVALERGPVRRWSHWAMRTGVVSPEFRFERAFPRPKPPQPRRA